MVAMSVRIVPTQVAFDVFFHLSQAAFRITQEKEGTVR